MSFYLLSLGCLKNSADSMGLSGKLSIEGHRPSSPEGADVLIVNTCGFIEDAKRESIDEIIRLAGTKGTRRLVVFGCLAKRYKDELLKEIPEIDAIFGVGEENKIIEYVIGGCGVPKRAGGDITVGKDFASLKVSVPLKVAEGCNRGCSFCVIPFIRGPLKSRDPEDILKEAQSHIKSGTRELLVVAQDLTGYKWNKDYGLSRLLKDIASISGDFWIRPLYLYPTGIDEVLLDAIAGEDKICKYFDVPFQHSEDKILRLMRRAGSKKKHIELIRRIRQVPDASLRTSFIVGFPGETEEDFEGLIGFVEEVGFDRLGAFIYSKEEGTPAALMEGHVPERVKKRRFDKLMRLQNGISLEKNKALVGRRLRALLEDEKTGRVYSQAPEIDGLTFIEGGENALRAGDFVDVLINRAYDYDVAGEAV